MLKPLIALALIEPTRAPLGSAGADDPSCGHPGVAFDATIDTQALRRSA